MGIFYEMGSIICAASQKRNSTWTLDIVANGEDDDEFAIGE